MDYLQANAVGGTGFEVRYTKKGKCLISVTPGTPRAQADALPRAGHDREKARFLSDGDVFLRVLGISDAQGRVHDRMRPKYRQISRFLELLDDVYPRLPENGTLTVFDLCCGKSYLSFAVYHYLTAVRQRTVRMYGVDRKTDVIAFCADAAQRCGYTGLQFLAGDIAQVLPDGTPDLVVSLHACDIATDLVLSAAVERQARVILSTPCCQHEVFHTLACPALSFLTEQSMLAQKFADAATDALRCKWLQAQGYEVAAVELVDPEQTPKNILLRAVRQPHPNAEAQRRFRAEYRAAAAFLGTAPTHLTDFERERNEPEHD